MKRVLTLLISVFLLVGIVYAVKNVNSLTNTDYQNFYHEGEYKLLGSIENKNIFLYGKEVDSGYSGMLLEIENKKKHYDWKSTFNITSYPPQLILADIDSDTKDELIIIRVEGYGTGIHIEAINVINPLTFNEIKIENPVDFIKKNVKFEIIPEQFRIYINEGVTTLPLSEYTDDMKDLYEKIEYNEEIRYFVESNKISANISLRFTPGSYIGYFTVNYKYSNNNLIIEQINFTAGEPNSHN